MVSSEWRLKVLSNSDLFGGKNVDHQADMDLRKYLSVFSIFETVFFNLINFGSDGNQKYH